MKSQTRGVAFHNVRTFVRARRGNAAWEEIRSGLSPEDRAIVDDASATGWYCLEAWTRLIRLMDKTIGDGDLALCAELARAGARRDVTPVLRALLSLTSPTFAIRNLTHLWSRHHSTGKWTVRVEEAHRVVLGLDDWGVVDRALCANLEAYLGAFATQVGGINVATKHPECRSRTAPTCIFEVTWV